MTSTQRRRFIFRATLGYAVLASTWIFFSDNLLSLFTDVDAIVGLSTVKGLIFVAVTTVLLNLALQSLSDGESSEAADLPAEDGPGDRRSPFFGEHRLVVYLFAILASLAMLWALEEIGDRFGGRPLLILCMLPIVISALLGGAGPGLLATLISASGIHFWGVYPPSHVNGTDPLAPLQIGTLVINGALLSILSEALHRGYRRWEKQHERLRGATMRLRDSEHRLRLAQDAARAGSWEWLLETGENRWSDEAWQLYGLTKDDTPPSYELWRRTVHPDEVAGVEATLQAAVRDGVEFELEWKVNLPEDAAPRWLMARGRPIHDADGKISRYIGIVIDISHRKAAELAMKETEAVLRDAQRLAGIGNWRWKVRTDEHIWSEEVYLIYGRDPSLPPAVYPEVRQYFTPQSWTQLAAAVEKSLADCTPYELDAEVVRPDGTRRWIVVRGEAICDARGEALELHGTVQDITERKRIAEELKRHRDHLGDLVAERTEALHRANLELARRADEIADIYHNAPCGYHCLDAEGRLVSINDTQLAWQGFTREEVLGRSFEALIAPHAIEGFREDFPRFMAEGSIRDVEFDLLRKDGSYMPVLLSATAVYDTEGRFVQSRSTLVDMTERKEAEAKLRIAAVAFQSRDGMVVTDSQGVILQVNRSFTEVTGYSAEEAIGKTPAMLQSGRHDAQFYRTMWEAILREGYWQGEIWNRRKDGGIYPEWLAISAIRDENGRITNYFAEFADISEPREAERKILELAFYDPLTGLPNRRLLLDRLHQAITSSARSNRFGALLLLDLDHFKTLNDTRGHDVGDQLLVEVAGRLREALREADTAARLGGDEFVVLLEDMGSEEVSAATAAEAVAEKVRASLDRPFMLKGLTYHIGTSIGITLFHDPSESVESLLKQADLALYQAKDAGRNTIRFYNPTMQSAVDIRVTLEAGLRRALMEKELILYYQPQIDRHGRLIGAEALLRWQPPGRKMVSPGEFIPVAETTGLIVPIGECVLVDACRQIAEWSRAPETCHLRIAVNISAQQFRQPDFVSHVAAALAQTGADSSLLKLELTESSVIQDMDAVIATMRALNDLGVGFSMDDFGTGYSSLAYLKRLPLEQLKIDQTFIRDIPGDPDSCAIARAIIALGQSLHLNVIAEGVETEEQRAFLALHGCDAYQGYLFGRPGPADAITALAQAVPLKTA